MPQIKNMTKEQLQEVIVNQTKDYLLMSQENKILTKENTKLIKQYIKSEKVKQIFSRDNDKYIEDIEKLKCELHEWREKYYHLKITGKDTEMYCKDCNDWINSMEKE